MFHPCVSKLDIRSTWECYVVPLRVLPSCPIYHVYCEMGLDLISCLWLKGGFVGFLLNTFTDLNPKSNTLLVTLTNYILWVIFVCLVASTKATSLLVFTCYLTGVEFPGWYSFIWIRLFVFVCVFIFAHALGRCRRWSYLHRLSPTQKT